MSRFETRVYRDVRIERGAEVAPGRRVHAHDVGAGQQVREPIVPSRIRLPGRQDVPVAGAPAPGGDGRIGYRPHGTGARIVPHGSGNTPRCPSIDRTDGREEIECAVTELVVHEAASHVEVDDDD